MGSPDRKWSTLADTIPSTRSSPMTSTAFSRRRLLALGLSAGTTTFLAACSSDDNTPSLPGGSSSSPAGSASFDSIVKAGPTASGSDVSGNPWAKKVKDSGALRWGGTTTSSLFSLKDPSTGAITGFDAGIVQLLSRYIFGGDDPMSTIKLTEVSVDTRETLLENRSVDIVVATYSITDERKTKISFAGPYYTSGVGIAVKKGATGIKSVTDLTGKVLVTQSNSTGLAAIKEHVKDPKQVLTFSGNAECQAAVVQGRADAYVNDQALLFAASKQKGQIEVVGDTFTTDPYGIGVTKGDNDAVTFINGFLGKIVADGSWKKLWTYSFGALRQGDVPTPPAVGA
ncbi:hypothetical protein C0Z10_07755 [Acidipropionibacterium jensenii]|uniref:Solute-binding protein family 3/N-terminal domain-containing protein n=2 Tax=Acidipropionibacterium jensenii TaxID=1749 RepID=A0A3T0RZY6_9ACTN|nr:hypothetical protein C0Z10_07755 [Acidipropionibacterium jensenii]